MAKASEFHAQLEQIRDAIDRKTEPDGTCGFDANQLRVVLNLALRCINDTALDT